MTETAESFRRAVLADQVGKVLAHIDAGFDPNGSLDDRGATALFFACTPEMVGALLEKGADPARTLEDGTSTLDAAAREGSLEIARRLVAAAPGLATEERALMAADHRETEALIRSVARGGDVSSGSAVGSSGGLSAIRFSWPRGRWVGPPKKGSQRYHFPARPGVLNASSTGTGAVPERTPAWLDPIPGGDIFAGPKGGVLIFEKSKAPRWVTADKSVTLDVPSLPFPYEHAFDASGRYFFFAYGPSRVVGFDAEAREKIVDLSLPGVFAGGNAYPARLAVAGSWLGIASLERLGVVPFGEASDAAPLWFTCQLGTCVAAARNDTLLILGARSGACVVGLSGKRPVRLADLPDGLFGTGLSARDRQLRMLLRVTGNGHDDPRAFSVTSDQSGTSIAATGALGLGLKQVWIADLQIDEEEAAASAIPTEGEIVDAFEFEQHIVLRRSPIGRDEFVDWQLQGTEQLWRSVFDQARVPTGDGFRIIRSGLPAPFPPPHAAIGQTMYPAVGPCGYAYGFRVSPRPGFWNIDIIDQDGAHPLTPPWYAGAIYSAFHDEAPRALMASGREAIEIDLRDRSWRARNLPRQAMGLCYFEDGIAIAVGGELWITPSLDTEPTTRFPATFRDAQLTSFSHRRVLWIPLANDRNVLLARRDGTWVIVGIFGAPASGQEHSPQGDFLALDRGALSFGGWEDGIRDAIPWDGRALDVCEGRRIAIG